MTFADDAGIDEGVSYVIFFSHFNVPFFFFSKFYYLFYIALFIMCLL